MKKKMKPRAEPTLREWIDHYSEMPDHEFESVWREAKKHLGPNTKIKKDTFTADLYADALIGIRTSIADGWRISTLLDTGMEYMRNAWAAQGNYGAGFQPFAVLIRTAQEVVGKSISGQDPEKRLPNLILEEVEALNRCKELLRLQQIILNKEMDLRTGSKEDPLVRVLDGAMKMDEVE